MINSFFHVAYTNIKFKWTAEERREKFKSSLLRFVVESSSMNDQQNIKVAKKKKHKIRSYVSMAGAFLYIFVIANMWKLGYRLSLSIICDIVILLHITTSNSHMSHRLFSSSSSQRLEWFSFYNLFHLENQSNACSDELIIKIIEALFVF